MVSRSIVDLENPDLTLRSSLQTVQNGFVCFSHQEYIVDAKKFSQIDISFSPKPTYMAGNLRAWYFVAKIVLTYCEKKLL